MVDEVLEFNVSKICIVNEMCMFRGLAHRLVSRYISNYFVSMPGLKNIHVMLSCVASNYNLYTLNEFC